MDTRIPLRVRLKHLIAAINALLFYGDRLHEEARHEPNASKKEALQAEADTCFSARKEFWNQQHGGPVKISSVDESVQGNSAPVQITRFNLPKDARELILAVVVACSILTSLVLWSKLHDAEKDIQTQIWLKQDKEEEKFQKFVAGPYAALAGELRANEILIQQCTKEKR